MYLKLIRERPDGKAVRGTLYKVHFRQTDTGSHSEELTKICDTLENADFLIPPLIYRVEVTMSPRFQRLLPILCNVPVLGSGPATLREYGAPDATSRSLFRRGIRLHRGTRPEHSKGCILVPGAEIESYITDLLARETRDCEVRLELTEKQETRKEVYYER